MKKLIIVFVFFVCLCKPIFSQKNNFNWAAKIGGNFEDCYAYSIDIDKNGNSYTVGTFRGLVDFDPGIGVNFKTSLAYNDFYLTKLDPSGNLIWVKQFKISNNGYRPLIKLDSKGHVYILGNINGTCDADPGVDSFFISSNGNTDVMLLKLDLDGNLITGKCFGGLNAERVNDFDIDDIGNIYTTGYFTGVCDFDPNGSVYNMSSNGSLDMYLSKYDSSFNFNWAKSIGGYFDDIGDKVTLIDNNIYVAGNFNDIVDLNPDTLINEFHTSNGMSDLFILKFDRNGNTIWSKQIGGRDVEYVYTMEHDKKSSLIIGGFFYDTVDFNPGIDTFNIVSKGLTDAYILKLDTLGNFNWVKTFGGTAYEMLVSIDIDSASNMYCTGYYTDSLDIDPDSSTYYLDYANSSDIFIAKFDSVGSLKWAKSINGFNEQIPFELKLDIFGNIYTVGIFNGSADFNTDSATLIFNTTGHLNGYIHKLGEMLPIINTPIDNMKICKGKNTRLTASGNGILTWYLSSNTDSIFSIGDTITTMNLDTTTAFFVQDSNFNSRVRIIVEVLDIPYISSFTTDSACGPSSIILYATSSIGEISWNRDSIGGPVIWRGLNYTTPILTQSKKYYLDVKNDICFSTNRVPINAIIKKVPIIQSTKDSSICGANFLTLFANPDSGTIYWYADTLSTSYLDTGNYYVTNFLSSSTTYFVQAELFDCKSSFKNVNAIIYPINLLITQNGSSLTSLQSGATYQWINCNTHSSIPGAVSQTYTPNSNGTYAVIINTGPCMDTSECISISNVGIEEKLVSTSFPIYPNPTTQKFFIELNANADIKITNAVGEVLLNEKRIAGIQEFNLENFASGIYFVNVVEKEREQTIKLIKE